MQPTSKNIVKQRLRPRSCVSRSLALLLTAGLLYPETAQAVGEPVETDGFSLLDLSLEELATIQVRIVSRREEPLFGAPGAIHVITNEDIEASGATTFADALRLAPGLQVAQLQSHQWAISSRGFNAISSNKLLVMMDGRSLYTPLFSGVYWDTQHAVLEDIEQIEVIRGPGASLWGANAVNGVINIVSKHSRDTQGTLVSAATGNLDDFIGNIRHGGQISDDHFYRVYFLHHNQDNFPSVGSFDVDDSWTFSQGGFRTDKTLSEITEFTLQGDLFHGRLGEGYNLVRENPPHAPYRDFEWVHTYGGNLLGRFTRSLESDADVTLQAYYDVNRRLTGSVEEQRNTLDLDFQHQLPQRSRHLLTWGLGYRLTMDEIGNTFDVTFDPDSTDLHLFSFFVQDEIELIEKRLALTLGSKFEHNDFTGLEVQPGARLGWTPNDQHTFWASIARAVRTPTRAESDIRVNTTVPGLPLISFFGSDENKSEEMIAYEIGYRTKPIDSVSLDIAAFFNDYDRLVSKEPGTGPRANPAPAHFPIFVANRIKGHSYGFEVAGTWQVAEPWQLEASYSYLQLDLQTAGGTDTETVEFTEGSSPEHQWLLGSTLNLSREWTWNTWFRFVDELPSVDVDAYLEMDMRLAWQVRENLELSLVGRNLLDSSHQEFGADTVVPTLAAEVPRSIYAKVAYKF